MSSLFEQYEMCVNCRILESALPSFGPITNHIQSKSDIRSVTLVSNCLATFL